MEDVAELFRQILTEIKGLRRDIKALRTQTEQQPDEWITGEEFKKRTSKTTRQIEWLRQHHPLLWHSPSGTTERKDGRLFRRGITYNWTYYQKLLRPPSE